MANASFIVFTFFLPQTKTVFFVLQRRFGNVEGKIRNRASFVSVTGHARS